MNKRIVLDDWQKEILDYDKDILLIKGRRIGGTEIFAIKAAEEMRKKAGTRIVMVSLSEDQAQLIVMVALEWVQMHFKNELEKKGNKKPKLNGFWLKNGSSLQVRPVGGTGESIRGFDGDILGVDEAPRQPKKMWAAARPIITTNAGRLWLWGTPSGKDGYVWDQYDLAVNKKDPDARFKVWHLSSEQVLLNRPVSEGWTQKQSDGVKKILSDEKKSMSEIEYGQEYLGLFLDDLARFFSEEWIEKVCVASPKDKSMNNVYLGIDCARFGRDESTWCAVEDLGDVLIQMSTYIRTKIDIPTGVNITLEQDKVYRPRKVGIDAGAGMIGVAWLDLLRTTHMRHKTIALNNKSITLDSDDEEKQRTLKQDMYYLTLALGEQGKLKLLNTEEVKSSLRSILQEAKQTPSGRQVIQIFGSKGSGGDHVCEAIVRAVYLAHKEKAFNLWAR